MVNLSEFWVTIVSAMLIFSVDRIFKMTFTNSIKPLIKKEKDNNKTKKRIAKAMTYLSKFV